MFSVPAGEPVPLVTLPVHVRVPLVASSVPPVELICMPLLNARLLPVSCCSVPPSSVSVPVPMEDDVLGVELVATTVVPVPEIVVPSEKVFCPDNVSTPPPLTTTAPGVVGPVASVIVPEMVCGVPGVVVKVGSPATVMALPILTPMPLTKDSAVPAAIDKVPEPSAELLPTEIVPAVNVVPPE